MTALDGKALLDHGHAIARRYAGRIGPDVAEELRAEAVLRALRSPPPDGRMQPWLERIYRNLFVDLWRRGRRATVDVSVVPEPAGEGTPEEDFLQRERRRMVREGLRRLPREARRALLSRYYAELDDEVAAARLGVAPPTVRTRIHRALARLRARLGDLRAFCPPILGKLGAQIAAVGMAPVLVAALVVVGSPAPVPVRETPTPVRHAVHPAKRDPGARPAPPQAPVVTLPPAPRVHVTKKSLMVTAPAPPSLPAAPATFLDPGEGDFLVGDILRPDGMDVFAEPPKPATPCWVEAPSSFMVQIEKMMEDHL